jgi:hypothetical protein
MRALPCAVGTRVEGLAMIRIAISSVRLEEAAASLRERGGAVPTVKRHTLDQPLPFEVPQIGWVLERRVPWVAQIALRHHPKRADRRERPRVRTVERILAIAVMDQLPLTAVRQVQIAHEHVAWIEPSAFVVTVASVEGALLAPVVTTFARVIVHRLVTKRPQIMLTAKDEPLILAVMNAVVAVARLGVSRVEIAGHRNLL